MAERQKTYSWFALVLYPEFDAFHSYILEYIHTNTNLYPISASVCHDRDSVADDCDAADFTDSLGEGCTDLREFKKAHTHILFKTCRQMTVSALLKRFDLTKINGFKLNYVLPIVDPIDYLQYMSHMDFKSLFNKCKSQYGINEFRGDMQFIQSGLLLEHATSNWRDLLGAYESIQKIGFAEFARQLVDRGNEVEAARMWQVFSKSQGLFLSAENQYKYKESRLM